ncbi:hypothetical protein [Nostoc sp.]|uniref:hypothetical protein n=1 Tax=Nostoc sp. TaxID=1180 RepID=UPI003FA54113
MLDGGYRGEEFIRWVMDMFWWIVEIVLRHLEKRVLSIYQSVELSNELLAGLIGADA